MPDPATKPASPDHVPAADHPFLDGQAEDGYFYPDYDGYCFAGVPETLLSVVSDDVDARLPADALGDANTDVDHVVVLLLDGLGWDQFHRDSDHAPLLDTLAERGSLRPLTSVYPSETAAAVTTFHSGQTPSEHGMLGWFQHVEAYGETLQTLPFTTLDDEPADEVIDGAEYGDLTDAEAPYPRVDDAEVHLYQPEKFDADDPGATNHPYWNVADAVAQLRADVEAAVADDAPPSYRYLYVPNVDTAAHGVGTRHARYRAQVDMVTEAVRREFLGNMAAAAAERTLFALTADHGHVNTDPETNVDLRETAAWDHVGDDAVVVGSPRNVQFHLEGSVDPVRDALESELDLVTFTREEYTDRELFGGGTCPRFEETAPDLVAVHREKGMWHDPAKLDMVGMHGGLTREEMFVPLAAGRVDDLRE